MQLRYSHATKGRAVGVSGRAVSGVVGRENSEAAVSKDVVELERESPCRRYEDSSSERGDDGT